MGGSLYFLCCCSVVQETAFAFVSNKRRFLDVMLQKYILIWMRGIQIWIDTFRNLSGCGAEVTFYNQMVPWFKSQLRQTRSFLYDNQHTVFFLISTLRCDVTGWCLITSRGSQCRGLLLWRQFKTDLRLNAFADRNKIWNSWWNMKSNAPTFRPRQRRSSRSKNFEPKSNGKTRLRRRRRGGRCSVNRNLSGSQRNKQMNLKPRILIRSVIYQIPRIMQTDIINTRQQPG